MKDVVIGLIVSIAVILILEIFKFFNKKIIAALTLVGIAFIYIGFTWQHIPELIVVSISVLLFMLLSYYGFTKNFKLIIVGLVLHGIWDITFPFFSNVVPKGYDIFCLTIDLILAFYFYFSDIKTAKNSNR
ncbi:MAG: hypothetical protein HOO86_04295 [Bacteroidales bacterium]|nr:hypothetical protein [Bacteroidales bacterium]